jgi:hypothetical protein
VIADLEPDGSAVGVRGPGGDLSNPTAPTALADLVRKPLACLVVIVDT